MTAPETPDALNDTADTVAPASAIDTSTWKWPPDTATIYSYDTPLRPSLHPLDARGKKNEEDEERDAFGRIVKKSMRDILSDLGS